MRKRISLLIPDDSDDAMPPLFRTGFLASRLQVDFPVIQAPMAGVSTPALAAAVSNAGALGSLGVAAMPPAEARKTIEQTQSLTSRPVNVNVFCHRPAVAHADRESAWLRYLAPHFARFGVAAPSSLRDLYKSFLVDDEMLDVLLQTRPAVVSFHFGLPGADRIRALKQAGIILLSSATSLPEAKAAEAAGVDAVVAQGIEAGGHRGVFDPAAPDERLGTMALVPQLVRGLGIPVIAAGGIMHGGGIAAALALGASAAQLGTAFVSCPESAADAAYREKLLAGSAVSTVLTSAISGRPARGLANRFTALGEAPDCPEALPDYPIVYDAGKALHAAAKSQGDHSYGAHWAGQAASLSRALPAAELVAVLRAEFEQQLTRLAA